MSKNMIPKTIEHWDDIDMTVIFTQEFEYTIEVFVAEIIATHIIEGDFKAERGWIKRGADSNMDFIFDPNQAESYLTGSIKWDGCSHLYFGDEGYIHFCGSNDVKKMNNLLTRIFKRCEEMFGDKALKGAFTS